MPGAWMERFKDRLVVRCNRTLEAWYLTCRQTSWIGAVSNCSEPGKRRLGECQDTRWLDEWMDDLMHGE